VADEYTEPTNKQLASFLMVYSQSNPIFAGLQLNQVILERLLDQNPEHREAALQHHRKFQDDVRELTRKIEAGELQCEHILKSGKRCPNRNEPGLMYCGLHKEEHGEPESS
jgi:hypothetical protein